MHDVDPSTNEYFPAPQLTQALDAVAPMEAEYDPAAQLMQVEPAVAAYLPAAQASHALDVAAPSADPLPNGQFVQMELPEVPAYVPARQLMHKDAPAVDENFPVGQLSQMVVEQY